MVPINTIIGSRDAIFDEMHFSSIQRPKDLTFESKEVKNLEIQDFGKGKEPQEPHRSKRGRIAKNLGSDFQLYLVEGSRD